MSMLNNSLSENDLIQLCTDLKLINDNAAQLETLSKRASDSADQGSRALSDVQSTLSSFADSTREINTLLEQINLLSQQVHILGVNAAIEAANAGEQGTGFTIIAEEMRRIAGLVKDTAVSIQTIMEKSGALADDTVSAIEVAGENLEILEISADLSAQLNQDSAEKAIEHKEHLEEILNLGDEQS